MFALTITFAVLFAPIIPQIMRACGNNLKQLSLSLRLLGIKKQQIRKVKLTVADAASVRAALLPFKEYYVHNTPADAGSVCHGTKQHANYRLKYNLSTPNGSPSNAIQFLKNDFRDAPLLR